MVLGSSRRFRIVDAVLDVHTLRRGLHRRHQDVNIRLRVVTVCNDRLPGSLMKDPTASLVGTYSRDGDSGT